uniref:Multifunctional fusion protein n=1 Tax=uncultured bacterium esnapd17 TaxID=1366598 RepID=S5UD47_9BACT|nr:acetyl-coenzyme A carboxyl transferase alpha chain/acetyl-coenzyme A carboxyl transferase beta chain [uncultured bacterium esnapd17]
MTRVDEPDVAAAEWQACPKCRAITFLRRLERNLHVCPDCGWHARLSAPQRIEQLLDPGSVTELPPAREVATDPLEFVDTRPYPERLDEAREQTGLDEAVLCVRGTIQGHPVVVAAMDFRFMGGSLGAAVGEMVTQAAETALADRVPLLIVTASGGARMQEGVLSLMQMAKTSQAIAQLDEAGILTVTLVTDPTYGGVAASFATLSDVIIAEPGARLGFAGPRVIEQTIREVLPPGFQTAEFLLEHGLLDMVRSRPELPVTLGRLLGMNATGTRGSDRTMPVNAGLSAEAVDKADDGLVRDPEQLPVRQPWDVVNAARDLARPTTRDYAHRILRDFEELHGDRIDGDCPALVGGLGVLNGHPVVLMGHQRGHDIAELTAHNFGMGSPHAYRKAARLMRLAAKLRLPVVTLVDTPGAYPGVDAEKQGQAVAIAENLRLMSGLPVPVVAVILGEGGSGGALALALADEVLMCSNAMYSVISPEGCASILWKNAAAAPLAAEALGIDARELLRLGVVDGVIPEPDGGSGADHGEAAARLERAVAARVHALRQRCPERLIADRRARFRRFGDLEGTRP